MKKNILLIMCSLLVITACKKEKLNDEILGRVVDFSDGSAIADSRVVFYNVNLNEGELIPSLESETEVRTDENGYFMIDRSIDASSICAGGHRLYYDNCAEVLHQMYIQEKIDLNYLPQSLISYVFNQIFEFAWRNTNGFLHNVSIDKMQVIEYCFS